MATNNSYGFFLSVQIFDRYKQDKTITQFIEELNTAFMLDNVNNDARKIAILQARTISHTRALFISITEGKTFLEYSEKCKQAVPEFLLEQAAMNKYLYINIDFENFEHSMHSFIRLADIALNNTIPI